MMVFLPRSVVRFTQSVLFKGRFWFGTRSDDSGLARGIVGMRAYSYHTQSQNKDVRCNLRFSSKVSLAA